jgi:hypothetical protein
MPTELVEVKAPRRNSFDLSHELKASFKMGNLYPVSFFDLVPGDKFRLSSEFMLRFQPLISPAMHRIDADMHFFFVPYRLIWNQWEDFITGGRDGTAAPAVPYIQLNNANASLFQKGTLSDYLGLPVVGSVTQPVDINALPYRAYQLIYDTYFRDPNLESELNISLSSGLITGSELTKITTLRRRKWEKDYFTSALPWPQRGNAVTMPIAISAAVTYRTPAKIYTTSYTPPAADTVLSGDPSTGDARNITRSSGAFSSNAVIDNIQSITATTATTIADLRRAVKLQEFLEKNARGGYRYIEQLLSHFGVRASNYMLQRPHYIGGGRVPVKISEVPTTYADPSGSGSPAASLRGMGVGLGALETYTFESEEHGILMVLFSIKPKSAYYQGIPKYFLKRDRFDWYWPEFAHIGEQTIDFRELYYTGSQGSGTFGYQERYAEYKYASSRVAGDMRDTLEFWHLARKFNTLPGLNESFVTVQPDETKRIFAVTSTNADDVVAQFIFNVDALRPMPLFGVPDFN